jgi:tetratricopeptide (TPR) repeat protein
VSPAGRGRPWSLWASRAALALLALGAAIGPGRRGAEEPPRGADRIHAEACTLYLKGLHLARQGTRNGVERGLGYLRQAVERDPRFGLAQVALADVYAGEGGELLGLAPAEAYGEAQRAAARALDIDPNLGPAHATLAALRFRYAWDWREAEAGFERARELSTCDPPEVDRRYAEYLSAMGRHEEALSALDGIVAAQPLDLGANWSLGRALYLARRYDGALAQLTATLDLDPHHPPTHRLLGEVHARRGDEAQAFAAFLEEARLLGASPSSLVSLEESFARAGLAGVRRWRLAWAPAGDGRADPVERARLLAELGEVRRALEALDRAYEERRSELVWVGSDPAFDPLRGEPRFRGLLTTLGLRATACG